MEKPIILLVGVALLTVPSLAYAQTGGIIINEDFEAGTSLFDQGNKWKTGKSQTDPPGTAGSNNVARAGNCNNVCAMSLATPLDLSAHASASIEFDRFISKTLEHNQRLEVQMHDGEDWATLAAWRASDGHADSQWHSESVPIDSRYLTSDANVRIYVQSKGPTTKVFVDNFSVVSGTAGFALTAPPDVTVDATAILTHVPPHILGAASVSGALPATYDTLGPFPTGTTTITWTATDPGGVEHTATQQVAVSPSSGLDPDVVMSEDFEGSELGWFAQNKGAWHVHGVSNQPPGASGGNEVARTIDCDRLCTLALERPLDLSGYGSVLVEFDRLLSRNLDGNERLELQLSSDVDNWKTVSTWSAADGHADSQWHSESVFIGPEHMAEGVGIRLWLKANESNERLLVDNFKVVRGTAEYTSPAVVILEDFEAGQGLFEGKTKWELGTSLTPPPGEGMNNKVMRAENCNYNCGLRLAAPLDLSGLSSASIELDRFISKKMEYPQRLEVAMSDGGEWETLASWHAADGHADSQWHSESVPIDPKYLKSGVTVRILAHVNSYVGKVFVDNIRIVGGTADFALSAPPDVTADATGVLTYVPPNVLGAASVLGALPATHDSPGVFPVGTTTITWTATDPDGVAQTATQQVTVSAPDGLEPDTVMYEDFESRLGWFLPAKGVWLATTSLPNPPGEGNDNKVARTITCRDICSIKLVQPIDLSGYGSATLGFDRFVSQNLDHGERLELQMSDGTGWTTIESWTTADAEADSQWYRESVQIGSEYLAEDINIRFWTNLDDAEGKVFIDNVSVTGTTGTG